MKRLFPVPPPIIVPDGTELHEIVGPRLLGELGVRLNDGLSLALGKLPAGIESKVHVHPLVWHFTWVRKGELTVAMKDTDVTQPYELLVPTHHGVLTEPGTFFQLLNRTDEPCEVFYFVGPAFVFEAEDDTVRYNDAVVFEHSWKELEAMDWKPRELPTPFVQRGKRHASLHRLAADGPPHEVGGERWRLLNGPGSVHVPSTLHRFLIEPTGLKHSEPTDPNRVGDPPRGTLQLISRVLEYMENELGLKFDKGFGPKVLQKFAKLKCGQSPSVLAEYEQAVQVLLLADAMMFPDEIWHLLFYGEHEDAGSESRLKRIKFHVLNEHFDFAATLGGGFQSTGAMENYRGYQGGRYSDPESYRHYIPGVEGDCR